MTSGLRSSQWFGQRDRDGIIHRSGLLMQGLPRDVADDRPVIGIANSWSELTPCNSHLRGLAESVKRGVWEAGGLPLEFPTISLGEQMIRPTAMFLRNLMAMDIEETLRANPVDGVVLLSGCDKTTPAQLMGAASVDLPTIMLTGGPQLTAHCGNEQLGSGTDLWRKSELARAGQISSDDLLELEGCAARSVGHCMSMGTASTMACMAEALGLQLPGGAAYPAVDARRYALAQRTGRRAVQLVRENLAMSKVLTREAFENAVRVLAAIGGSTNAVIHLIAIAGRAGVPFGLADLDRIARDVPTLVNLKPSGEFLMEDFAYAGGVPAVLFELLSLLHTDAPTVSGQTIGEHAQEASDRKVIMSLGSPLLPAGSAGRPFRQYLPQRGRHQAKRREPFASGPPWTGARFRLHRRLQRVARRRQPPCRRRHCPRGAQRRPPRLPRHARGRQLAIAAGAAGARDLRRGAHLRRPHERDGLRDGRAPCGA